MEVVVSYYARDVYNIPDEVWREALSECKGDETDAFISLQSGEYFREGDIDDWQMEVVNEKR